ncbi:MAG: metallophosphoesterase [Dehalococcoidia bacterium]|nr:metallophosphoesterase [Dehalococcoidia bacterium]
MKGTLMRILVLADIHSNLQALEAVAADAETRGGWDAVWCLGDVVGYGPDPNACIAWLREQQATVIAGNHDLACVGAIQLVDFNAWATASCQWTQTKLTPASAAYLRALTKPPLVVGDFTLTHGSLVDPVWEYTTTAQVAAASMLRQTTPWCLVGHAHLPLSFGRPARGGDVTATALTEGVAITANGRRVLCNPGSVGQPRDGDPRAAYAVVDLAAGTLTPYRVGRRRGGSAAADAGGGTAGAAGEPTGCR